MRAVEVLPDLPRQEQVECKWLLLGNHRQIVATTIERSVQTGAGRSHSDTE